jgi:polyhydroxyalkanoate synthesis repressor PhaR
MREATIEIRKYPNRRYYNTRDSVHVTLEEIRDLVRGGHDIKVVDSRTEEDITVAVLTQILLEIESPKLAFFPANFLQHLIRLNTDMFKNMTDSYFRTSLVNFMKSAESAQGGVAPGFGLPLTGAMEDWQRMWSGMFPKPAGAPQPPPPKSTAKPAPETADQVADLKRQIDEMREALNEIKRRRKK